MESEGEREVSRGHSRYSHEPTEIVGGLTKY